MHKDLKFCTTEEAVDEPRFATHPFHGVAAGSSFAFPSQTTYVEQGPGLDPDRARAAEARVQAWRERGELYLPRLPPEQIAAIDNTLPYPADGSATGTGLGR